MAQSINKGSSEHVAHLENLKVAAKAGDKAAAENLKQHESTKIEVKSESKTK